MYRREFAIEHEERASDATVAFRKRCTCLMKNSRVRRDLNHTTTENVLVWQLLETEYIFAIASKNILASKDASVYVNVEKSI